MARARIDWDNFVANHWERAATVLRGALESPLVTREQLFDAIVTASTAFRERADRGRHIRVMIEGRQLLVDLDPSLPRASHGSVDGYLAEVAREDGFGLVINELQKYSPPLFFALRDVFSGLFEKTGLPLQNAVAVTFIGNYRRSAFGVHRDDFSNFQFVLAGRKRYRLWPSDVFGDVHTVDDPDYARFLDQSIVLEGGAGDIIYWPASDYHVAEVDEDNAASIAFIVPTRKHARSCFFDTLERALPPDPEPGFAPANHDVSRFSRSLGDALAAIAADRAELEHKLLPDWLVRVSSAAMLPPPPLADAALDDDAWVATDRRWPIVCVNRGDTAVVCANGNALEMPPHPCITSMIEALNDGRPHNVGQLIAAHQGEATIGDELMVVEADEVRSVLEALYSFRAVTRAVPPSATALMT